MSKIKALTAAVAAALLGTACSWVEPPPQGEQVRVVSSAEVSGCKKVGQTTVSLLAKLAGIERNPEKVQEELNILARNSAVQLDGDTVVPAGTVEDGQQTFDVYRCTPR